MIENEEERSSVVDPLDQSADFTIAERGVGAHPASRLADEEYVDTGERRITDAFRHWANPVAVRLQQLDEATKRLTFRGVRVAVGLVDRHDWTAIALKRRWARCRLGTRAVLGSRDRSREHQRDYRHDAWA